MPKLEQTDLLFKMFEKKPITASAKELKENIPSRSAKLRYVIKKDNFYNFETDIYKKFEYLIKIENLGDKLWKIYSYFFISISSNVYSIY